ncbi:hypothetical protein PEDI_17790 [Persicobacter diffluens]|uniref:Uncharacterized protein n=1 Tax=Persicobacter diffluens TaxID=981 RepID=A0AAN5AJU8_9BACT|nr:hypothetical protein PEDI_17790 [Persicobacter diffluens]
MYDPKEVNLRKVNRGFLSSFLIAIEFHVIFINFLISVDFYFGFIFVRFYFFLTWTGKY